MIISIVNLQRLWADSRLIILKLKGRINFNNKK